MKKTFCVLMSILLLFCCFSVSTEAKTLSSGTSISINSKCTEKYGFSKGIDFERINVGKCNEMVMQLELIANGQKYNGSLSQIMYESFESIGFAAAYEGVVVSHGSSIHLIADVLSNNNSLRIVLTVYNKADDGVDALLFFGNVTDGIRAVSEAYGQKRAEERNSSSSDDDQQSRVNAAVIFQGSKSSKLGNKVVSTESYYHSDELRNQSSTQVYVKANSNTANMLSYLRNDMYMGTYCQSVYPYREEMTIKGNDVNLYYVTGTNDPVANQKNITILFPYVNLSGSLSFASLTYTTSTTTFTRTQLSGSSSGHYNNIKWVIQKNGVNGWGTSINGDSSTNTGLGFSSFYTFSANVTGNLLVTYSFVSKLSYEYVYVTNLTDYLHISAPQITANSYLTIVP